MKTSAILLALGFFFSFTRAIANPNEIYWDDGSNERLEVIELNSHVDGSSRYGGTQPDYVISDRDPYLMEFFKYVEHEVELNKAKTLPAVVKVVKAIIREKVFLHREYNNPLYTELNKIYVKSGARVPVGEYIKISAGVCREHALLLHLALNHLSIPNFFSYARVKNFGIIEDHAFVVVNFEGKSWIADAYNDAFDGRLLSDAKNNRFTNPMSQLAPWANRFARKSKYLYKNYIQYFLNFPLISRLSDDPEKGAAQCREAFL
jgi:hypothetical protein